MKTRFFKICQKTVRKKIKYGNVGLKICNNLLARRVLLSMTVFYIEVQNSQNSPPPLYFEKKISIRFCSVGEVLDAQLYQTFLMYFGRSQGVLEGHGPLPNFFGIHFFGKYLKNRSRYVNRLKRLKITIVGLQF